MNKKILILIIFLSLCAVILAVITVPKSQKEISPSPIPTTNFTPAPTIEKQGTGIESPAYKQAEKEYVESTPILQKLPAKSIYFEIEYISEKGLIVRSKTGNTDLDYQAAKNWFIENDIKVNNIQVEYK